MNDGPLTTPRAIPSDGMSDQQPPPPDDDAPEGAAPPPPSPIADPPPIPDPPPIADAPSFAPLEGAPTTPGTPPVTPSAPPAGFGTPQPPAPGAPQLPPPGTYGATPPPGAYGAPPPPGGFGAPPPSGGYGGPPPAGFSPPPPAGFGAPPPQAGFGGPPPGIWGPPPPGSGVPPAQPWNAMPVGEKNGLATAAMVVGIVSLVVFWMCGLGALTGLVAVVLGAVALSKSNKLPDRLGRGQAIAGLVTGGIAVAISIAFLAFLVVAGDDVENFEDINTDPSDGVCDEGRYWEDPDC